MNIFKKKNKEGLEGDSLQTKIDALQALYTPMDLNYQYHKNKVSAIVKLNYILKNTSRKNLQDCKFDHLQICSLVLVYYFGMRLKLNSQSSWYSFRRRKRNFREVENAFQKTMEMLQPERNEQTIKTTIKFFTDVELWPYEGFVVQILEVILYFNRGSLKLFNLMLTDIHYVLFNDIKSARHRMRVLYGLLKSENWIIENTNLLPFITRLLDFFANSIKDDVSSYKYLRMGFEVCLRRIFERVENCHRLTVITTMLNWFSMVNMHEQSILEFSSLIERAAELYEVKSYAESFSNGVFRHVVKNLVGSNYPLYSLVGCRLLLKFLDKRNNAPYFVTPVLYYEFTEVKFKIGSCDNNDKNFLRTHREKMHEYILRAVRKHCHSTVNLKAVFAVICCLILEVPCGLTAAVAACILMSMQDHAINGENVSATSRYWIHAIVVSVMSLICKVHEAPVLYAYVNQITSRRAKEAPQLNPPLMPVYSIGQHHVTWNKPSLFFEDWELRYSLWKHFQDSKKVDFNYFALVTFTLLPWQLAGDQKTLIIQEVWAAEYSYICVSLIN